MRRCCFLPLLSPAGELWRERIAAPPPVDSNHSNNSYELCNLFFISAVPPTAFCPAADNDNSSSCPALVHQYKSSFPSIILIRTLRAADAPSPPSITNWKLAEFRKKNNEIEKNLLPDHPYSHCVSSRVCRITLPFLCECSVETALKKSEKIDDFGWYWLSSLL